MVTLIQRLRRLPLRLTQDLCGNLLNETNANRTLYGYFQMSQVPQLSQALILSIHSRAEVSRKGRLSPLSIFILAPTNLMSPLSPQILQYEESRVSLLYTTNIPRAHYVCHSWKSNHVFLLFKSKKFEMWPGLSDSNAACWVRLGWVNTDGK